MADGRTSGTRRGGWDVIQHIRVCMNDSVWIQNSASTHHRTSAIELRRGREAVQVWVRTRWGGLAAVKRSRDIQRGGTHIEDERARAPREREPKRIRG